MTKLDTFLETLEKLDAVRTQEEWILFGDYLVGVDLGASNPIVASTKTTLGSADGKANAEFIVAAVNSNAKLREIIKIQREALEFYGFKIVAEALNSKRLQITTETGRVARQALERAEDFL
jgi:hypothetical protein